MATHTRPETKARTFGENIESDLASRFLRVVETAAIASARTMGKGDRRLADDVATQAMRRTMDNVPMRGTIVIGEGERDEAPMLYIGEKVGAEFPDGTEVPEVDIAVDPLEGTNLCATGAPGAITVLAASERNGLLNAPDCYMEKIVVGPSCKNAVELDAPVADNLKNIARPVRTHRVLLGPAVVEPSGVPAAAAPTARAPQQKPSIAVLPFANMSGDPEQEYFSDGISEDIITDLSKVSALWVAARNTAFTFKGKHVDVPQVARQLKVSHVLEGSVRKAGGSM
jgi:hypothetical protein